MPNGSVHLRLHTTTVLSLSALAVLALASCSTGGTSSTGPASSATAPPENASAPTPLSSAALAKRLLNERDLGEGYARTPQRLAVHDDVAVIGCPALEKLGADAATGSGLDISRKAKAPFTYDGGSGCEVSEELYSDTAAKFSKGIVLVSPAIGTCGVAQR